MTARSTIALAILAAVLLLAGCAHASMPKDPFVGTWRLTPPHNNAAMTLVIWKVEGARRVTYLRDGGAWNGRFARHGDRLVNHPNPGGPDEIDITYVPSTGHLLDFDARAPGILEWRRVSGSTALPTPSP